MNKLTIFYDGKCNLCFREIRHYKKLDKNNNLKTIDISANNFDAKKYGLDPEKIHIIMHAIDEEGIFHLGVDTFVEIWKRVPPYNKLTFVLESKTLRPFLNKMYKVFAYHIRPRLPRRKCENDNCEIIL